MLAWYPGHELILEDIVRAENCRWWTRRENRTLDLESGVWCTPWARAPRGPPGDHRSTGPGGPHRVQLHQPGGGGGGRGAARPRRFRERPLRVSSARAARRWSTGSGPPGRFPAAAVHDHGRFLLRGLRIGQHPGERQLARLRLDRLRAVPGRNRVRRGLPALVLDPLRADRRLSPGAGQLLGPGPLPAEEADPGHRPEPSGRTAGWSWSTR